MHNQKEVLSSKGGKIQCIAEFCKIHYDGSESYKVDLHARCFQPIVSLTRPAWKFVSFLYHCTSPPLYLALQVGQKNTNRPMFGIYRRRHVTHSSSFRHAITCWIIRFFRFHSQSTYSPYWRMAGRNNTPQSISPPSTYTRSLLWVVRSWEASLSQFIILVASSVCTIITFLCSFIHILNVILFPKQWQWTVSTSLSRLNF